jgi:hypothetical protein
MKYQAFVGSPHFFIGRSTKGTVNYVECTLQKALTCFSLCYLTTIAIRIGISKAGRFLEDFIPFFLSRISIYFKEKIF